MKTRIVIGICTIVAAMLLGGLAMRGRPALEPLATPELDHASVAAADAWNKRMVDSAVSRLHTGDMVLRMGHGADSYLLARLNHKDKSYSHCGIVVVEGGKPYVYHAIGGEDNPDERLRKDPAGFFFSPVYNGAISIVRHDLPTAQVQRLVTIVKDYYKARPRFDMQFDLATDDKLYCSEFVYKSFIKASADSVFFSTTQGVARRYVAIDDLFVNRHARTLFQVKFKQYLYQLNQ